MKSQFSLIFQVKSFLILVWNMEVSQVIGPSQ